MNNGINIINKGFDYECHETFYTLEEKAESMVDNRLHGNLRKGAKFEAYIFLLIEQIIQLLGLQNKLKVTHNPFTYRRYFSRKGRGTDIAVYRRKSDNWIPLFFIECKDWTSRWLSPAQLKTHVISRFKDLVGATKLLICRGIKFSAKTAQQLQLNQVTVITNITKQLKQTIINKMYNTNIYNTILHKHKYTKYYIDGSEQYPPPNLTRFNVQSVGCGENG